MGPNQGDAGTIQFRDQYESIEQGREKRGRRGVGIPAQRHHFCRRARDQLRIYPNQNLAAHVLGYVSSEGQGLDGIEVVMEPKLKGVRGWRQTERDRRGRELVAFREQDVEAHPGFNVVLTIDAVLQISSNLSLPKRW
jgi:hypothetical protein